MSESAIVRRIESEIIIAGRYYANVHGGKYADNGHPDILTSDAAGRLVGLEVKKPGGLPSIAQLRRGAEIIEGGGRFVLALQDFRLISLEDGSLEEMLIIGDEFQMYEMIESDGLPHSFELVRSKQ